jgi:phosphatidylserine/phosphatidylglycerophosphate/cardiolipin synthase-like enzyme
MPGKRRSSKRNTSVTLATLVVLVLLGIYYALTGNNPGEVFETAVPKVDTPVSQVATANVPPVNVTTAPNNGTWEVYFTDPVNMKDPNQWQNSVEGKLIEKINAAQSSIHIVSFEFDLTPVAEALVAAHNRGVDVRWVTDDEHGIEADEEPGGGQFATLQAAGIEVRADTRSALMHNKFWLFDGQTAWTGSTNITASSVFQQNNNAIVIHSPEVVAIYEREFQEMWDGQFGPRSPSTADQQTVVVNGTPIQIYFSPEDKVLDHIIPIVANAQSNIRFLAFSFTDYPLAKAMIDRAAVGVDVAGVYEKVGSETEGAELKTFYCAGVPVRQDGNPRFLHHKLIIVDNHIVISGSFNFSSNATENNDENVIIIDNAEIANLYMQEFGKIWGIATDPDPAKLPCQ